MMNFNLTEFFYNLVPGIIFLLFWLKKVKLLQDYLLFIQTLLKNDLMTAVFLLVSALTLGLTLHGIFRTLKFILVKVFTYVMKYCPDKKTNKNNERTEHMMNAYLWAKNYRQLPEFFSARSAIWGSSLIGLAISYFITNQYFAIYLILGIVLISMYAADHTKEKNSIRTTYTIINMKPTYLSSLSDQVKKNRNKR